MKYIIAFFLVFISVAVFSQIREKKSVKQTAASSPKLPDERNTTITLENKVFDFGRVTEGEYVTHRVWIYNTGVKDLIISDISAPCISADYLFAPLKSGTKTYIDVTFSTKGKVGKQYREVSINGNIENPEQAIIYISGIVEPK